MTTTEILLMKERKRLSLNGRWNYLADREAAFSIDSLPDGPWNEMTIPTNWQLDGLENYSEVVWFRRRFQFTPNREKRSRLCFLGVDYFAKVWLNRTYLGEHEGYFQPFEFNVTEVIEPGENEVLVRVDSPKETPKETPGEAWPDRKRLVKGVLNHHDCRPGSWNPDQGQDMSTGGIWNSILIYQTNDIRVESVRIAPVLLDDGAAALTIKAVLERLY